MGNAANGMGDGFGMGQDPERQKREAEKKREEQKDRLHMTTTNFGRKKKRKGERFDSLPKVNPTSKCRLRLLAQERLCQHLLLQADFVYHQVHGVEQSDDEKESDKKEKKLSAGDKESIEEIRGIPLQVGTLEEMIDDKHAVVTHSGGGAVYYVPILSFVDRDELEPNCKVLLHNKTNAVCGILQKEADPMVKMMKVEESPKETYADIGGLDTQIMELKEAVELPLVHPELYDEIGIKPPKGVILFGPPGTGKTLLAKAVANETSATFLRVCGSELVQAYLGDGPKLVRELFKMADENAPSIVFIDEIDAVGAKRKSTSSSGGREIQRTMLELLNQLDGFDSRGDVKVIMATNRIEDLDPALIRPGRIDRKIELPNPDGATRRRIFDIHTVKMSLADDVDLEEFVNAKDEVSGADVKAICTEAGLLALRDRRMRVSMKDFRRAKDKAIYRKRGNIPEGLYL